MVIQYIEYGMYKMKQQLTITLDGIVYLMVLSRVTLLQKMKTIHIDIIIR